MHQPVCGGRLAPKAGPPFTSSSLPSEGHGCFLLQAWPLGHTDPAPKDGHVHAEPQARSEVPHRASGLPGPVGFTHSFLPLCTEASYCYDGHSTKGKAWHREVKKLASSHTAVMTNLRSEVGSSIMGFKPVHTAFPTADG